MKSSTVFYIRPPVFFLLGFLAVFCFTACSADTSDGYESELRSFGYSFGGTNDLAIVPMKNKILKIDEEFSFFLISKELKSKKAEKGVFAYNTNIYFWVGTNYSYKGIDPRTSKVLTNAINKFEERINSDIRLGWRAGTTTKGRDLWTGDFLLLLEKSPPLRSGFDLSPVVVRGDELFSKRSIINDGPRVSFIPVRNYLALKYFFSDVWAIYEKGEGLVSEKVPGTFCELIDVYGVEFPDGVVERYEGLFE